MEISVTFDIERLVPRFLLADKNGWALCQGIEKAFRAMIDAANEGVKILTDVEAMPEWRLDECAWEMNCLYDYNADVDSKRAWIRSAIQCGRVLGTPGGLKQYLEGVFDRVEIKENWDYGGDPYHYKVETWGEWTPDKENWLKEAADEAGSLRSVNDGLIIHNTPAESELQVYVGIALYGHERQRFAQGEQPDLDSEDLLADGGGVLLADGWGVVLGG